MIKKRDYKAIDTLSKIARDLPPVKSARIASSIFIGNKHISFGVNQAKTSPFQKRFARNDKCGALIHSEIDCIKNALRRVSVNDLSKATMYISRMKYKNSDLECEEMEWGMCKPCSGCRMALNSFNIKRVVYTTDEQTLEEMC